MDNATTKNALKDYALRVERASAAQSEIIAEDSDFPEIETRYEDKGSFPGLPGWCTPSEGIWRIVNTSMHDGYAVVTEECIGYMENSFYVLQEEDGEHEFPFQYYVSVAPGYRPTRLRKVWVDDIEMARFEENGRLSDKDSA